MSYAYAQKRRGTGQNKAPSHSGGGMDTAGRNIPNSVRLAMLEAGQAAPTAADKGRRVDMPEAMRAKMESSFGMDFSAVKLYESDMLGQTGAEAMAQGNEIAFAPGKLDFASQEGQARLGHELSHVASQARGQVHGNGFLLDHSLEARADREGAMAARGESVYGGAVAPLSAASAAPMAGPMQASKSPEEVAAKEKAKRGKKLDRLTRIAHGNLYNSMEGGMKGGTPLQIKKGDDKFFDENIQGMSPEMIDDLMERQGQLINKIYESRQMMQGDDKDKLDMRAGISEDMMDLNANQFIISQIALRGNQDQYDRVGKINQERTKADPEFEKRGAVVNELNNTGKYEGNQEFEALFHNMAQRSKKKYTGK